MKRRIFWSVVDAGVIFLGIWSDSWWWKATATVMAVLVVAIAHLDGVLLEKVDP